jgi:hypothetical protein
MCELVGTNPRGSKRAVTSCETAGSINPVDAAGSVAPFDATAGVGGHEGSIQA